ncbi:VOC family protein [Phytohabitans kaempferiae]|uniref:VOC family protein n=1 Tax=Phytohabitans kaempferiae TaxID=1620943 RepID=A0ABV6MIE2_9ACTN
MRPTATVVSLPVNDLDRSLRFYRDGLGLSTPGIDEYMIAFELPNLSLFLIESSQYQTYLDRAGVARSTATAGACILSCAIATKTEVDEIISRAGEAGGTARAAIEDDGSYTGYIRDPDGHVWELVCNDRTARAAARSPVTKGRRHT